MSDQPQPSPLLFFATVTAYQRSAAIKAAIELQVFAAIGKESATPADIASRIGCAERGVRILCDFLTIAGFLTKQDGRYRLTPDSALFLDSTSPAYVGAAIEFLGSATVKEAFEELTEAVRKGGNPRPHGATLNPEDPIWVRFAQGMAPLSVPAAHGLVSLLDPAGDRPLKVLDIAAGHGIYGIAFAQRNPRTEVYAVDWAPVLAVAAENAKVAGVAERHHAIPGSAFEVEYGFGYDLVLLTNFLHHFDSATNEALLKKVHAALKTGGKAVALDFVPNDDRISPEGAAGFSLTMLATTPSGDAYTFKELDSMYRSAGFARSELHEIPPMQRAVVSYK